MLTISESASVNGMARSSEPPVAANFDCVAVVGSLVLTEAELSALVACVLRHG